MEINELEILDKLDEISISPLPELNIDIKLVKNNEKDIIINNGYMYVKDSSNNYNMITKNILDLENYRIYELFIDSKNSSNSSYSIITNNIKQNNTDLSLVENILLTSNDNNFGDNTFNINEVKNIEIKDTLHRNINIEINNFTLFSNRIVLTYIINTIDNYNNLNNKRYFLFFKINK